MSCDSSLLLEVAHIALLLNHELAQSHTVLLLNHVHLSQAMRLLVAVENPSSQLHASSFDDILVATSFAAVSGGTFSLATGFAAPGPSGSLVGYCILPAAGK